MPFVSCLDVIITMSRLALAALAIVSLLMTAAAKEPYGIGLEGFAYPYPVQFQGLSHDGEPVRMAYMDVAAKG